MSHACDVLVVDDDPDIREAIKDFLEESGFIVACAADGREALDRLARAPTPPCLILLDVMMPGMDGREFRRRQMVDRELSRIPVALITADLRIAAKKMNVSDESGAWDLFGDLERVAKPFEGEELILLIRRHCKRGAAGVGSPP